MTTDTLDMGVQTTVPPAPMPICYLCKVELCDYCEQCEQETCALFGKHVTTRAQMIELKHLLAVTQKAKGYALIAESLTVPRPYCIVTEPDDIDAAIQKMKGVKTLFARPCPVRPRHGFVESRVVQTDRQTDLTQILAAAKAADPQAELLVVPAIDAAYNLILTPPRMAIGEGNDGATSGRGSRSFPLSGVPFAEITPELLKRATIAADEDPYIEVVIQKGIDPKQVYFTQLRAGVRVPAAVGADYIPAEITVTAIVEASGDLLEWERQVRDDIKAGTVVYHIGGTLISHYGVHCMFNTIPILTSRIPTVGETLIPTAKPIDPDPLAVIDGLALGADSSQIGLILDERTHSDAAVKLRCADAVAMLLVTAHNAAAMGGDDGRWIGIATSLMMRLGMSASHGEARHKAEDFKGSREWVYRLALNDFMDARDTLGHAQWRFKNLSWSSSYGGPKWAACTESIFRLERDARALMRDPSAATVAALVTSLHNAINQAHNGGWWLNKFVQQADFDQAAKQSVHMIAKAAPAIFAIASTPLVADALFIDRWRAAADIAIVKGTTVGDGKSPENEDDAGSAGDLSDDSCGDPNCTSCNPSDDPDDDDEANAPITTAEIATTLSSEPDSTADDVETFNYMTAHGAINNYPKPPGSLVTVVQGNLDCTGEVHFQYRLNTIGPHAYYSCDSIFEKPANMPDGWQESVKATKTHPSFAGSTNKYAAFTATPIPDRPGWWCFANTYLNVSVEVHVGGV